MLSCASRSRGTGSRWMTLRAVLSGLCGIDPGNRSGFDTPSWSSATRTDLLRAGPDGVRRAIARILGCRLQSGRAAPVIGLDHLQEVFSTWRNNGALGRRAPHGSRFAGQFRVERPRAVSRPHGSGSEWPLTIGPRSVNVTVAKS